MIVKEHKFDGHNHRDIQLRINRDLIIADLEQMCDYFPYDYKPGKKSWKIKVEGYLQYLAATRIEIPVKTSARVNRLLEMCSD